MVMAAFAGTGGTAAPSPAPLRAIRASGAAQALGAPKGVTRARPAGKMPGKAAKAPGKMPGQGGQHPSRAIGQRSGAQRRVVAFNPAERTYNEGQLAHLGERQAQTQANAELGHFRSQALETAAQERAVQQRYTGYANTTQTLLGQQQQAAEGSAKTFENQAADNALQTGKSIETAGQNAATLTGGYLDPAVKAQLQSESQRAGQAASAQGSFAQNLGQNETNFLGNLRAAAAQRATEGHGQIAGVYGKALGAIQGKEAEATSKVVPNSLKFANEIGQKQLVDQASLKGLGIKRETLGAKVAEGKAKLAVQERGQNLTRLTSRENATEKTRLSERGQNITARKNEFNEWAKRQEIPIKELSAKDKARYDEARTRIDEGKAANSAAGRKYLVSLNNALSTVQTELAEGRKRGYTGQQLYNIARKQLAEGKHTGSGRGPGKPLGTNLINAALNLAVYGRLSTADQAEAQALGLTPQMKPEWFRSK